MTETFIIRPSTPSHNVSSFNSKRKLTPSSESSTSKKSFVLSPQGSISREKQILHLTGSPLFESSTRFFESGQATIEHHSVIETSHAHPERLNVVNPPPSRHILLPFNLYGNRKAFTRENMEVLFRLFPDTLAVSFDGYFLIFQFISLPPEPWPKTIAGVQPYFTTDLNDIGPLSPFIKRPSKRVLRLSHEIDAQDLPSHKIDNAFDLVKNIFIDIGVSITEIQYWNTFFVVVLESQITDMEQMPSEIAHCPCYYLFENEIGRPPPNEYPARRVQELGVNIADDSIYDTLRPGVMISSGRSQYTGIECLTPSGVLVKDSFGNHFMTVASHRFPHGDKVFHARSGGREIGQIEAELTHTDIAIVKLRDEEKFINETFESSVDDIQPVKLQVFLPSNETYIGSEIFMNNPFTGFSQGTCGPHTLTRVPSDNQNEPVMAWIKTRWTYLGQGFINELVDGICGSAVWSKEGKVLGFFRYAVKWGGLLNWGLTVTSEEITKWDYQISD